MATVLAAAVLTACSGGGADPTAAEPSAPATAPPSTPAPATTEGSTTTVARSTASPSSSSSAPAATGAAPTTQPAPSDGSCLPVFAPPRRLLDMRFGPEPFITAGDFNGDGAPDIVVTRLRFQSYTEFPLEIYLNAGSRLVEATPDIFPGTIPQVQHRAVVLTEDFNGDGIDDIFVADSGYDAPPFPGYQNALALSTPDGLVDGTPGLPQQADYSHGAAAGDVDGDGDIDLYVGNIWGGEGGGVGPQIWLNDGAGRFTVAVGSLPAQIADRDFGAYLTAEFVDVDGDGDLDLVLGDAGDTLARGPFSEVLRNDGAGRFLAVEGAMPPKRRSSDLVHDIEAADIDGDGAPDLFVVAERSGSGGSSVQLLRNLGDGHFEDVTEQRVDPLQRQVWVPALDLIDIDDDGDLDLLARPWDDQRPDPILWLNRDGHFELTDYRFGLGYLYYDFLDWDGDGGTDIVVAGFDLLRDRGCNG